MKTPGQAPAAAAPPGAAAFLPDQIAAPARGPYTPHRPGGSAGSVIAPSSGNVPQEPA